MIEYTLNRENKESSQIDIFNRVTGSERYQLRVMEELLDINGCSRLFLVENGEYSLSGFEKNALANAAVSYERFLFLLALYSKKFKTDLLVRVPPAFIELELIRKVGNPDNMRLLIPFRDTIVDLIKIDKNGYGEILKEYVNIQDRIDSVLPFAKLINIYGDKLFPASDMGRTLIFPYMSTTEFINSIDIPTKDSIVFPSPADSLEDKNDMAQLLRENGIGKYATLGVKIEPAIDRERFINNVLAAIQAFVRQYPGKKIFLKLNSKGVSGLSSVEVDNEILLKINENLHNKPLLKLFVGKMIDRLRGVVDFTSPGRVEELRVPLKDGLGNFELNLSGINIIGSRFKPNPIGRMIVEKSGCAGVVYPRKLFVPSDFKFGKELYDEMGEFYKTLSGSEMLANYKGPFSIDVIPVIDGDEMSIKVNDFNPRQGGRTNALAVYANRNLRRLFPNGVVDYRVTVPQCTNYEDAFRIYSRLFGNNIIPYSTSLAFFCGEGLDLKLVCDSGILNEEGIKGLKMEISKIIGYDVE